MSKPKNMTADQEAAWYIEKRKYALIRYYNNKARLLAGCKAYRETHKDECRKREKEWRIKNEEKCKRYSIKHYQENKEYYKLKSISWKNANPEKCKAVMLKGAKKHYWKNRDKIINNQTSDRKNLTLGYVARMIGLKATVAKQHPDLIEAKRDQIKILRELKPITRKNKHNAQEPE